VVNRRIKKALFRWTQTVFSIFMISSLVVGCGLPWEAQPDSATQTVEEFQFAEEPVPVQDQQGDLPPALVEVSPTPASSLALQQPITLFFNQAMDADSVEAAIHFEPRISGLFRWEDERTVTFTPDQNLTAGCQLRLTLDTSTQAANLRNLQEPVELNFQVADFLRVVQTVPKDGTQDVNPESAVFIAFNQPVMALGDRSQAEPGFSLSPEVPGSGEWLNTSTYVFTPDPSMLGGTTYTLQLNPNLVATSGASLAPTQAFEFDFTTTHPQIVNVLPLPGELLSLNGPVELEFNIRMDPHSVESNFSLTGLGGMNMPGRFEWDESERKVTFTPVRLLSRDANYTIRLGQGAESAGGLPIVEGLETVWQTYPDFAVNLNVPPEFESYYGGYGQFMLEFTTPLDPNTLDEQIRIEPEVAGVDYYASGEGVLSVNGYFQPETTYTLIIEAGLQDIWGGQLGEVFTTSFITPPAPPSLSVSVGYTSYNLLFVPSSESEIILQATNVNTVNMEIAPISTNDLVTLLHPDNYRYREIFLPEVREVTTHTLDLNSNRREVVNLPLLYQGEPLTPGVYYLGINVPDIPQEEPESSQKYYLVVSDNNLVMKIAPGQAFVWATRLDDLNPLANVPIKIYDTEGELLTSGQLDDDGLFLNAYEHTERPFSNYFALVGEPGEEDFAFSISFWQQSFYLYEQGIQVDTLPALLDAYIYTDRPIYRPGDTINFKTLVFSRENGLPVLPALDTVTVTMNGAPSMSGRLSTLYSKALTLTPFGTASGTVQLPDDAPTGQYWINVFVADELINALYFEVAAYRKPDIDLAVAFEEPDYLVGEDIFAEAQANYFFGLPAAERPFSWTLFRKDIDFNLPGYQVGPLEDFGARSFFPSFSPLGEIIANGEGITNDEGHMGLTFTGEDLDLEALQSGQLQQFNLEVSVRGQNDLPISFRDATLVHPESYYIGVQPSAYFGNAGSMFDFSVLTVNWEQEPAGNIPLEATFEAIRWEVERTGNPEKPYRYSEETTLISGASPVTDREGRARMSFTPDDPGTYRLTIESGGAVTQVLIWVSGESAAFWPRAVYNQIELTADASDYQPGQFAQIFIPNPFTSGARALVTVERGEIMDTQVVEVSGAGVTISIPITEASTPNIYVSAILVGRNDAGQPDYRHGTIKLLVPPLNKTLNVDVSLDPIQTEPGETVSLTLKITDRQGHPVQGEFSIAVVDKALLALMSPNSLSIIEAIYQERPLSVQSSFSLYTYAKAQALTSLEEGGLGGGADLAMENTLREDFPDTAFWQAHVITGVDGTAQLSVPLPDTLTTWVVDVRGLTEDYFVGQAEAVLQTQKPLMIQPLTPRFVVDGDQVEMAAVVHNNTESTLDVDVSLQAVGFTLLDANLTQQVTIEPGDNRRVTWWGTVDSVESVKLVFNAEAESYSDASAPVWGDLPVSRYAMPFTFSTAGRLAEAGERLELVSLPVTTDPSSGELSVVMNLSLLVTLVDSLQALEHDPSSDTVTILSQLLANLHTYQVLNNLDIDLPQLSASLDDLIGEGVDQLLDVQNFDGGWSWWGSQKRGTQESDPFITAYVILGLTAAHQAGIEIEADILTRAKDYLVFELPLPGEVESAWMLDRLAFQIFALRTFDLNLSATIDGLYARRSELSPWAIGLLALTLRETMGNTAQVATLINDLEGRAVRSATAVHWESERLSWSLPGTPIFNTAVAVYTLAQLDPASASLPLALRYLMTHQNANKLWSSTFESAWVLMAVAKAVQGTGDYQADFDFRATLNEVVIAEGLAAGPESLNSVTASTGIDTLDPDAPNPLRISRGAGDGTLYYRVDLNTYQPAKTAQAVQRGINLHREYYHSGEECPEGEGCLPIESIRIDPEDPSQYITVVLTVNVSQAMYHLLIEDFIPSGTEVLNPGLLTSPTVPESPFGRYDPRDPFAGGWGWWYFNPPQIYDDHVLWSADYVPAGTYVLTYELLPYQRGAYQVLPAHAWQFFYPEVQGTTPGDLFIIE